MDGLRAIVLAAIALGLLVAVGGSAEATTLCEENVNPCPLEQRYPVKETILASKTGGGAMSYLATTMGIARFSGECQETSISWSTTENRGVGAVLFGNVSAMLYGKCKNGMSPCEKVTAENLPYNAELVPTVGGDGNAPLVNGKTGVRKLKFEKCGPTLVNCTYEPGEIPLVLKGGSPATISVFWSVKSEGGNPACGEKIEMLGSYTVAAPKTPLWVESSP